MGRTSPLVGLQIELACLVISAFEKFLDTSFASIFLFVSYEISNAGWCEGRRYGLFHESLVTSRGGLCIQSYQ